MENKKQKEKKVVLFLVEGESEITALEVPMTLFLEELDKDIEVRFLKSIHPQRKRKDEEGGDITAALGINQDNIEEQICDQFLKHFFNQSHIYPLDVTEIIHIVDIDGVFIPDEKILEEQQTSKLFYNSDCIKTKDVSGTIKRNKQKAGNLKYLYQLPTLQISEDVEVPYSVYYFSCNLDHFLHHDANLDYRLKVDLAEEFMINYLDNTSDFVKFFAEDPDAAQNMTYKKSWSFIKRDVNSLQRHTNLNVLLEHLKFELDPEPRF